MKISTILFVVIILLIYSSETITAQTSEVNTIINFSDFSPFDSYREKYQELIKSWAIQSYNYKQDFGYGEYVSFGPNIFNVYSGNVFDLSTKRFGKITSPPNYCNPCYRPEGSYYKKIMAKFAEEGKLYWVSPDNYNFYKKWNPEDLDMDNPNFYSDTFWYSKKEELRNGEVYNVYSDKATPITSIDPLKSYEINEGNKIYTYENISTPKEIIDQLDFDNELNVTYLQKVKAVHSHEEMALVTKGDLKKIINVNKIIFKIGNKINNGYSAIESRIDFKWDFVSINSISPTNYLIKIKIDGSYSSYLPNETHGLSFDVHRSSILGIVINQNLDVVAKGSIINGDATILTNNNLFYEVFNKGMGVSCYDQFLNVKWSHLFGSKDEENGDKIEYAKIYDNKLYLMGSSKNFHHVGFEEPLILILDSKTGQISKKVGVESDKVDAKITGFFNRDNKLFVILDGCKIVYACDAYNKAITRLSGSKNEIGSIADDFTQNDTANNPVSLSSLRGKYVLLYFWSSWEMNCRIETIPLIDIYNNYKNKNFTVLGVSLDNDRSSWLNDISDFKLPWTQVSDLKRFANSAARLYNIKHIPSNVLIDPNGKIIAKDVKERELSLLLYKLLQTSGIQKNGLENKVRTSFESVSSIQIGNQIWAKKNLNTSKFSDGEELLHAHSEEEWEKACKNKQPAYCYLKFSDSNETKYGKIYNLFAVLNEKNLVPNGWKIPDTNEWSKMIEFLGGNSVAGGKLKSKSDWDGNNTSGFSALHGGESWGDESFTGFWTSTQYFLNRGAVSYFELNSNNESIMPSRFYSSRCINEVGLYKNNRGFYIRCIKN